MSSMSENIDPKPKWREWFDQLFSESTPEPTTKDISESLGEAVGAQLHDPDTVKIMLGAVHVAEMHARDIMIPRARMACVKVDASPEQIIKQIAESHHTRFPVVGDVIDDIRGILHAKDLLINLKGEKKNDLDVSKLYRSASLIPESKRLNVLLKDFRSSHRHMAIVVDEFGHVSGLVTIEDILEQIVGDIEDEHDKADADDNSIVRLDQSRYRVKGDTLIEDFNTYFNMELSNYDHETVGGLITQMFGYVPVNGDQLDVDTMTFRVVNADSRRITLLQVTTP